MNGNLGIANNFKAQYENLYNSVVDDDKDQLGNKVKQLINNCSSNRCPNSHSFSLSNITDAISSLKSIQKDYIYEIYSNNFIYGTNRLFILLNMIFNACLIHGCTDLVFNQSVTVPIVKDMRKSLNDSTNYRALTLGSTICKIFEYLLLNMIEDDIKSKLYQFAFKGNHSTTLCSSMVLQTIEYYKHKNSNAYVLFLDCSKAFDKVKHSKLFNLLIKKNICPLVIRIIMNMYACNNSKVKWNNVKSDSFCMGNGVKQGGVLSPALFNQYLDPLLDDLRNSGVGCHIGGVCTNSFAYADDIALLSPSMNAMSKLIEICERYSKDFSISFNPSKCSLLVFSDDIDHRIGDPKVYMFGKQISIANDYKHLGHIISNERNMVDFNNIISDMKVKTNIVTSDF